MLPGWYHDRDWFLQAHNTNCTESEMIEAVNGHFEFDFAQIRLDYENKILLTNKVSCLLLLLFTDVTCVTYCYRLWLMWLLNFDTV